MRYVGGKSKLTKGIRDAILVDTACRRAYLEPFLGGGSVFSVMAPLFRFTAAGDTSLDLMMMWNALKEGWSPPESISEALYRELKLSDPSALRGLAGFGGSFGGKWFGGYARGGYRSDGTPRNHFGESRRAVLRIAASMADTFLSCKPYWEWTIDRQTVVYCDPPYEATQEYAAVDQFDHDKFWQVMDQWVDLGAAVYVSEYSAPEGWDCIAEINHSLSLTRPDQGREKRIERLWRFGKSGC